MLENVKRCTMCGKIISDLNDEKTDYFRHIRLKYCPICRETAEHLQGVDRVRRYRERKRQQDKARDDQLRLLQEENELLRQRVAQLRQSVDAPEELHSAHSSGARWFDR